LEFVGGEAGGVEQRHPPSVTWQAEVEGAAEETTFAYGWHLVYTGGTAIVLAMSSTIRLHLYRIYWVDLPRVG